MGISSSIYCACLICFCDSRWERLGDFAEDPVHRQFRLGENTNQMGSECPAKENITICNSKRNFCLRDYVLAARKNGIAANWPFHSKHLDIFKRHGISSVLPPFEPCLSAKLDSCKKDKDFSHHSLKDESSSANSIDENSDMNIARCEQTSKSGADTWMKEAIVDVSKKICSLTIDAGRNGHCGCDEEYIRDLNKNKSCLSELRKNPELFYQEKIPNTSLSSTLKLVKISNRKGKRKMRLLVDIYEEAKPVTLEDTDQINSHHCREISTVNGESKKHKKKSELHLGILKKKHSRDLRENHFPNKKRCVRMSRTNGC